MAVYYFRNTGSTAWSTAANWSLTDGGGATGAVPTTADDAVFTTNSGNCTTNAAGAVCKTLSFATYGAKTFTLVNSLTVSGSITLGASMTIVGTAQVTVNAAATLTSNGISLPGQLVFSGTSMIVTLADNWTIGTAVFGMTAGSTLTLNANTLNTNSISVTTISTVSGTTTIKLIGTGTWSHAASGYIQNNLTIASTTTTLGANVYYGVGTLTYSSGSLVIGTSTLNLSGSTTINAPGIYWNNVIVNGTSTITSTSNFNVTGTLTIATSATVSFSLGVNSLLFTNASSTLVGSFAIQAAAAALATFTLPSDLTVLNATLGSSNGSPTINSNTMYIAGNLTVNGTGAILGTTNLVMNGTGTWSHGTNAALRNNLTINTSGTITVSGIVYYNTGTITYTAGTVNCGTSTLTIAASTTLDTDRGGGNKIAWANVSYPGTGATLTLTTDLTMSGAFTNSATNTVTSANKTMYVGGSFTCGALTFTSTTVVMNGTGTVTTTSSISGTGEFQINTTGTITFAATSIFNISTFTYIAGAVDNTTNDATMTILSPTITSGSILWNNLVIAPNATITFLSDVYVNKLLTLGQLGFASVLNGYSIYARGSVTIGGTSSVVSGTTTLQLVGSGTLSSTQTTGSVQINITINTGARITFTTGLRYSTGTFTYIRGILETRGIILTLATACRLIGFHKTAFENISIVAGITVTMDQFFGGNASLYTTVRSSSTATNYTIVFTDNFERIAKFVRISNCTISNRNQLLLLTNKSNKGNNTGIRYTNHSPNGIPKNTPFIPESLDKGAHTYLAAGLVADPSFVNP
jgi:hypothetical protein